MVYGKEENNEQKGGNDIMTIEKALNLSSAEFAKLSDECNGFNDEVYKNHQVHNEGETYGEFIEKGSYRIKENPIIKGNLI